MPKTEKAATRSKAGPTATKQCSNTKEMAARHRMRTRSQARSSSVPANPPLTDLERSKVVDSLIKSGVFLRPDAEAILASPAIAAAFSSPACVAALTSADAIATLSSPCALDILSSPIDGSWLSGIAAIAFFSSSRLVEGLMQPSTVEAVALPEVVKEVPRAFLLAAVSSVMAAGLLSALAILTQHPSFAATRRVFSLSMVHAPSDPDERTQQQRVLCFLTLIRVPQFTAYLTAPDIIDFYAKFNAQDFLQTVRKGIERVRETGQMPTELVENEDGHWSLLP